MKVQVKNNVIESDIKYPRLMISTNRNCIVLFNQYQCGTCIYSGETNNGVGVYSKYWEMSAFVPFNGEVTLKND